MPPKPKTRAQVEKEKQKIVTASLEIILKQGLDALTMRKLASKLHMSATNMYNYFYSKDEIYLYILIKGFDLLYQCLLEAAEKEENAPTDQLEKFIRAYIQFGKDYSSYYSLMFDSRDTSTSPSVNAAIEHLALQEKSISLRPFELLNTLVGNCLPSTSDSQILTISTRIFCEIHGYISLYISNVLKETGVDIHDLTENLVQHVLDIVQ